MQARQQLTNGVDGSPARSYLRWEGVSNGEAYRDRLHCNV